MKYGVLEYNPMKDFFISYNSADEGWAKWIAGQLEEAKYTTNLQVWDFRPAHNFVLEMDRASRETERTILVLSPDFLRSSFTPSEWAVAFKKDPTGEKGLIVPVRVRKCEPDGLLSTINRIDLIGLEEEAAKKALLGGVKFERVKPTTTPDFPGSRSVTEKPRFPGSLPPVWNVPFNRNPNFIGRCSLLTDLHFALNSGQYAALTQAITGLGGVGKTQLALEYVYSYINDYEIIWWVRSEETSTLAADYVGLAVDLNLPESSLADQKIVVEAVRRKLGQLDDWLLIFDNAAKPEDIDAYLPQGGGGHVIITSRNQDWDVLAREMPIHVFDEAEAVEFIWKRTGENDPDSVKGLARELDRLPLALEQACAYIKTRNISVAEYLELFRQRKTELLEFPLSRKDYDYTVATTWDISFKKAGEEVPASSDLLNLCAFLAPDEIPKSLLSGGGEHLPESLASTVADEMAFYDAVAVLKRYSLTTVTDDYLSIHRLVQAVTRDRLSEKEQKAWSEAAVRLMSDAFPDSDDVRTWSECSVLLPHALAAAGHAEGLEAAPEATVNLLNRAGNYLFRRGDFNEAKTAYEKALSIFEAVYGEDAAHPPGARTLMNLGNVLRQKGDLDGAKIALEKALSIYEAVYGEGAAHPSVAMTFGNLGTVLHQKGNIDGAKSAYEKALSIYDEVYGKDAAHPSVAMTFGNLGAVLHEKNDIDGAKTAFEKALSIYEAVYGKDAAHPDVAGALMNLGTVLGKKGDIDGAKSAYEKALSIYEAVYGKDAIHPDVAGALMNFGAVLHQKGDIGGAKTAYEKALSIFEDEKVYGKDAAHLSVAGALMNLGNVLRQKGDLDGAKIALGQALSIYEAVYGKDAAHPDVALTLMNLGTVLYQKGDIDGAKSAYEKTLSIFEDEKVYGKDAIHPDVAMTHMNIGNVLLLKGDIDGAKTAYEKALSIFEDEKVYGEDAAHPSVATTFGNLGTVLYQKGDIDGAKIALGQALSIYDEVYGEDAAHPDVAGTLMNLGTVLLLKGDIDGAKIALEKALSIYDEVYGEDAAHPDVAMTHMNIGNVLLLKGDIDGAKIALEKALSIYETVYGEDAAHPSVALALGNLGNVLRQKGDIDGAKTAYEKALKMFREQFGEDHPYTTRVRNELESLKRTM